MNFIKDKKVVAIITIIISLLFFIPFLFTNKEKVIKRVFTVDNKKDTCYYLDSDISFTDRNDIHLIFARKNGLKKTYETDDAFLHDVDSLTISGKLVYISDKKNYVVKRLTHSYPYLIRQARNLLDEIGTEVDKKQIEQGLIPHKIIVTSMFRTEQSQCHLRRCNNNATREVSSHLYGATFDISSQRFVKKDFFGRETYCYQLEYKRILEQVLQQFRAEGRCAIVREFKQSCFHITVVK